MDMKIHVYSSNKWIIWHGYRMDTSTRVAIDGLAKRRGTESNLPYDL